MVIIVVSILALLCLAGLGYCYFSVRRDRLDYQKMRHEQQEEMNALIDEIQSVRKKNATNLKSKTPLKLQSQADFFNIFSYIYTIIVSSYRNGIKCIL